MHTQVNIAVAASDDTDRKLLVEAVSGFDQVFVSEFTIDENGKSQMLDSNPDVIICRHDGKMQRCDSLISWLDEQSKVRKVMTMLIVDEDVDHHVSDAVKNRLDQFLVGMPDVTEIQRNVSLLIRLVRSENEVMSSNKLNQDLKESEDKYRSIVNSLEDGYFEINHDGKILFLNASMERILAMEGHKVAGLSISDILEFESAARFNTLIDRVRHYKIHTRGERWEIKTVTGHYRVVELSLVPMQQSQNSAIRDRKSVV